MEISIRSNLNEIQRNLDRFARRQLPFATAMAVNDVARDAKAAVRKAMEDVFNQPVSRTLNSVRIKTGTKAKPEAIVWIDDEPNKGIAAAKYLAAEILGGQRRQKRFERALQSKGLMPPGTFAVPGSAAPLDGNGNIPGSFIVQLLSYLGAFGEQGYRANMTQKRKAKIHGMTRSPAGYKKIGGVMYFVSKGDSRTSHLAPGIYAKTGTHGVNIKPVILFVRPPQYGVRLKFFRIVENSVSKTFATRLRERLAKAMATAK